MAKRKAAAVSMDEQMHDRAKQRAESLGLPTFSAYVVQLIRRDLAERGELTLREDAPTYQVVPAKKKRGAA